MSAILKPNTHVVDILGNVIGRDQPILRMEKAFELASFISEESYKDNSTVFFDPFCKAGELLLSCAHMSCIKKVEDSSNLMSIKDIYNEIFESNKYFALAPDERHHRLSLRTFLGNSNSHNGQYNEIIRNGNYLSEIDGTLNKEVFIKELENMIEYIKEKSGNKKIVAIGNPPYQESDSGHGGSASAIYNYFVEALMDNKDISELVVVIPSRWFTSGKGAKSFRERVISSTTIKNIKHFMNSKDVFPTVDVQGGVCFFHHQSNYNGKAQFIMDDSSSKVDLSRFDIILDDPKGYDLVDKVIQKWDGDFVSSIAWSVRPWAIRTFYFQRNDALPDGHRKAIPCFSKGRKIFNANIDDIPKNLDKVDDWKVAVPTGYSLGSRRVTLPPHQFFIIPKGHITTETYNIVGSFKKKVEAENFRNYLATNFVRYFLGLRKVTQHIYQKQWSWVPLIDFSKEWTDKTLFKHFGITQEEQKHIAKKLKEWS